MATEAQIQWARFPLIASHSHARVWLQIQANLGLARNTIEAYGRALEDYLKFSSNSSINIEAATQEHISQYVHHLINKPQLSEPNVRRIDSKAGLANATIQQRLTAVRLYYDYLVEEGIRKQILSGVGNTRRAKDLPVTANAVCSGGTPNCPGFRTRNNGFRSFRRPKPNLCAIE